MNGLANMLLRMCLTVSAVTFSVPVANAAVPLLPCVAGRSRARGKVSSMLLLKIRTRPTGLCRSTSGTGNQ